MSRPLPALLQTFRELPGIVEPYFRSIPTDRLDIRRTAEAWTLREHLYHLATVQPMLLGRMQRFRDEVHPVITPYFPEREVALAERYVSIDAAFEEYRTRRIQQSELLETVPAEVWERQGVHPEYERYDLGLVVHHLVFHEYWHFYRIEELWLTRDEFLS